MTGQNNTISKNYVNKMQIGCYADTRFCRILIFLLIKYIINNYSILLYDITHYIKYIIK